MLKEFESLWVEKWRPKTLSDLVLTKENRELFDGYRKEQNIPNILFIGAPGTGKTTLAKIIVNDILDCQYCYINASDESGVDTIRTKVVSFAQTKSIDGKIKVVILDEADGISGEGSRALRNTIEEYSAITRFILTGNYLFRIIPAIQSRCIPFDLTPTLPAVNKRCEFILDSEKVKYKDEDVEKIVRNYYPDLRKCIGILQKHSKTGILTLPKEHEISEFVQNIFKLVKGKKVLLVRKWIIEGESKFNGDYSNLLRQLFNYVYEQELEENIKKQYLIIISEYLYRAIAVVDQEINCFCCLLQLSEVK